MNIALFGFGSVGRETARYLLHKTDTLRARTSCIPSLSVVYTRTPQKALDAGIPKNLISSDWKSIIDNPAIDCVVELMGGIEFPLEVIRAALARKKHVVTANKALLAQHGAELWKTAQQHGVCLAFEASCGGGIPIVRAVTDGLIANEITSVYGVLNGTCNFILSDMQRKNVGFADALADAQRLGLAEADPTLDVGGFDAGHKIAVISSLSFNTKVDMDAVPVTGISEVESADIFFANMLGYTIQLIAAAIKTDAQPKNKTGNRQISVWVHPALLENAHPMASLEGSFNAVRVTGSETGPTLYAGRGAGGEATSSAVISDLVAIANGSAQKIYESIQMRADKNTQSLQTGMDALRASAYIRLTVQDEAGVLAQIADVLKRHRISIRRVLQEDLPHTPQKFRSAEHVALIIITHAASWENVRGAHEAFRTLSVVKDAPAVYPIVDF